MRPCLKDLQVDFRYRAVPSQVNLLFVCDRKDRVDWVLEVVAAVVSLQVPPDLIVGKCWSHQELNV